MKSRSRDGLAAKGLFKMTNYSEMKMGHNLDKVESLQVCLELIHGLANCIGSKGTWI